MRNPKCETCKAVWLYKERGGGTRFLEGFGDFKIQEAKAERETSDNEKGKKESKDCDATPKSARARRMR
jgi:hypothetical protein